VIRAAAEEAEATADDDLAAVVRAARDGASAALEATPQMLPALADAGVVDAGGKGVLLLLQTFVAALEGEPIPAPEEVHKLEAARPRGPRYEVMFLLGASEGAVGDMTQAWSKLGESIIVGGEGGTYNCHIHTDRVEETLGAAKAAGAMSEVAVTDLYEEVGGRRSARDCCSLIAIAEGSGTAKLLESLGADAVLEPSQVTGDGLRRVIEGRPTPEVVLLVAGDELDEVAQRARETTSKKLAVRVVPSAAEALAEIVFFDPAVPADGNVAALDHAAADVKSGRVTASDGGYVALQGHDEVAAGDDVTDVAVALLDDLIRDHHEVVTVLTGRGVPKGAEARLRARLQEEHPDIVAELYEGGGTDLFTFCAS
jgi:dihydroxyacetone kinase-like predicted kinase